jgi:hypothetical protein
VELHRHIASDGDALTAESQGCGIESPKSEDGAGEFFNLLTGRPLHLRIRLPLCQPGARGNGRR